MTIRDYSPEEYHADDLGSDQPSLSASMATILCTRSPLHAFTAHPKLNPNWQRREEQKFDVGVIAHSLILEGIEKVSVVDAANWRTDAAKEARDEARAAGLIPLLPDQWTEVQAMVQAVREQLAEHEADPPLFMDGKPEQTLVWEEDGVLCRARLDWLRDDLRAVDDLKSTSRSAHPQSYARNLFNVGGDVQASFYLRGLRTLYPDASPEWRWVVVETSPPYALSVVRPGADMLALGDAKVEKAIRIWRECLETGEWPAYGTAVAEAEMPAYEEAAWMAREAAEEVAA